MGSLTKGRGGSCMNTADQGRTPHGGKGGSQRVVDRSTSLSLRLTTTADGEIHSVGQMSAGSDVRGFGGCPGRGRRWRWRLEPRWQPQLGWPLPLRWLSQPQEQLRLCRSGPPREGINPRSSALRDQPFEITLKATSKNPDHYCTWLNKE